MRKKKWNKPKLIILTRGKSEERVLLFCKGGIGTGGATGDYGSACFAGWSCHGWCSALSAS